MAAVAAGISSDASSEVLSLLFNGEDERVPSTVTFEHRTNESLINRAWTRVCRLVAYASPIHPLTTSVVARAESGRPSPNAAPGTTIASCCGTTDAASAFKASLTADLSGALRKRDETTVKNQKSTV